MKFLIINDLTGVGGSELQVSRESNLLKKNNHEVIILTFNGELPEGKIQNGKYNIPIRHGLMYKKLFLRTLKDYYTDIILFTKLYLFIGKCKPDVIHVNNISERAVTIYKALIKAAKHNDFFCFQTLRDARSVCMTGLGICRDNKLCRGYLCEKCIRKCPSGRRIRDYFNDYLHYSLLKKINILRKEAFDVLVSPSKYLQNMCDANGIDAVVMNDFLDNREIHNKKVIHSDDIKSGQKIFLSYGRLCEIKGTFRLIKAFIKFASKENVKNVKLILAGTISDTDEVILNKLIKDKDYIEYAGIIEHKMLPSFLQKMYAVIVPSIVAENYPNTALEGYAAHKVVIGTDRAGTAEIIGDKRFLFDVNDEDDIVNKLMKVYSLSEEDYNNVTDKKYNELCENNTEMVYYHNIMKLLSVKNTNIKLQ